MALLIKLLVNTTLWIFTNLPGHILTVSSSPAKLLGVKCQIIQLERLEGQFSIC